MIKVRLQLADSGSTKISPIKMASRLIREEGFSTLYKGLSAAVIRQLTYGTTRLGIFRTLTNKFTPEGGKASDIPFPTLVGCSLTAGGIGALIGTPADVALVRMQADTLLPKEQQRGYKNVFDALIKISRQEGMAGFFSGATPTIMRGLSINVGMLTTYDYIKKINSSWAGENTQTNRFVSGFFSGWIAATLCLPFDFLKTRLQRMKPNADGTYPYKGVADAARKIIAKEGILSLYTGYPTFVFRIIPHIMFTWLIMDNVKAALENRNM